MFGFLGVASPPLATLTWMVKLLEYCFEHEAFLVYLFSTTTHLGLALRYGKVENHSNSPHVRPRIQGFGY